MKSDIKITRSKQSAHVNDMQRKVWRSYRRWRFVGLAIVFIGFVSGTYWVVIASDLMRFDAMEIHGNEHLSQEDIQLFLEHRIPKRSGPQSLLGYSHFWLWPSEWREDELKDLPHLKSVKFEADYGERKLRVNVKERTFIGVWCNNMSGGTDCVWFDEEGIAFEPSLKPDGYLVFHINDNASTSRTLGESVIGENYLANIQVLEEALRQSGVSYRNYELTAERDEMSVQLRNGPELRFSLEFPTPFINDVLNSLRRREIFSQLSYVDFRIQNKVFYK